MKTHLRRGLAVLVLLALAAAVPATLAIGHAPDAGVAGGVPVWGPAALPAPAVSAAAGTRTELVRLSSRGRPRTAIVLTPRTDRPVPLVVVLHGRNSTPAQELVRTGLTDLASNGSAVLAYPAGIGRSWNATTGCCSTAAKQHVNDVAFLQVLLTAIEKHVAVDPSRVYLVGYSNGGRLALTAACAVPGIAGVATYGTAQPARCPAGRPPPVFIGYGSADPHAAPGYVPGRGTTGPVTAADWRSVEGCADAPSRTTVGPATVTEWTSCRGDGRVALVRWDGLTHRWPGGGVVPADATGRALMWRFLTGSI
ncbi:polyhydroxybutyrate depolymerase [Kribbella orskensis]|uniref:Polyhydroxybutyrate depolymerase n=1 Tax=Kribbella orskensis TaxID=2512216 RepID=A0ABY2BA38_9ACTN|nr:MULTISPECIES: PHB depolymerase family esterase [Kribbella]TCN32879.1 polyhydroxybutyrate depolymerase [Kribbella sp. VKM Ac-2500]TCO13247.1 polyhydroxybutyrate depolymerase [Kribbella orskensis]